MTPAQPGVETATDATDIGAIVRPSAQQDAAVQQDATVQQDTTGQQTGPRTQFGEFDTGRAVDTGTGVRSDLSGTGQFGTTTAGQFGTLGASIQAAPDGRLTVNSLQGDSVLFDAGLRPGDAIVSVGGQQIGSAAELQQMIAGAQQQLPLVVWRDGRQQTLFLPAGIGSRLVGGTALGTLATGLRFADGDRLLVSAVTPQTIWAQAGLLPGDAVIAVNGEPVDSLVAFQRQLASTDARGRIPIMVHRDGRYQNIHIQREVLGYRPEGSANGSHRAWLGVFLDNRYQNQAVVEEVQVGSAADRAGIRAGDWITAVNGQPIRSPSHLSQLISNLEPGSQIDLEVAQRQRTTKAVELGARAEPYERYDEAGVENGDRGLEGNSQQLRDGSNIR